MSITIETETEKNPEQINESTDYIFNGIKSILEKDEFGLFELKSKKKIDEEIERIDDQIQKMIEVTQDRKEKNTKLSELVQQLKNENESKAKTLIERIDPDAD